MPATENLTSLRTEIRQRADIVNSQVVTDAELNGYINGSIKDFLNKLAKHYGEEYLVASPYELVVGSSDLLALPVDHGKLLSLDVHNSARWVTVYRFNRSDRNRLANPVVGGFGTWANVRYHLEGDNLRLAPQPTAGTRMRIHYVPRHPVLADSGTITLDSVQPDPETVTSNGSGHGGADAVTVANGPYNPTAGTYDLSAWPTTGYVILTDLYYNTATIMEYINLELLGDNTWRLTFRDYIPVGMTATLTITRVPSLGSVASPIRALSDGTGWNSSTAITLSPSFDVSLWPTSGRVLVTDNVALRFAIVNYTLDPANSLITLATATASGWTGTLLFAPLPEYTGVAATITINGNTFSNSMSTAQLAAAINAAALGVTAVATSSTVVTLTPDNGASRVVWSTNRPASMALSPTAPVWVGWLDDRDGLVEYVKLDVIIKCKVKQDQDPSVEMAQKNAMIVSISEDAANRDQNEAPVPQDVTGSDFMGGPGDPFFRRGY